jgi:hypothetical protein
MADPTYNLDADAARQALADQLDSLDTNIAELDAQLLKLRAVIQAAIRSGALDADTAKKVALTLIAALSEARGWQSRLAEIRRAAPEAI